MHNEDRNDDEIELIDILRVLWKRKALIVLGSLLLAFAGAGASLLMTEVYKVSAIVEPGKRPISNEKGQIVEEKVLASTESIKETILGGAFDESIQDELQIPESEYPKVQVSLPKNTELIKLSIESPDTARARDVLKAVIAKVSRDIEDKIKQEKSQIQSNIKLALNVYKGEREQVKLLAEQVEETKATIDELKTDRKKAMASRSTDAMAVLLYSNEIQNKQMYLNELNRELKEMETQSQASEITVEQLNLKLAGIKATSVHKEPTASLNPVKPKKTLIVALSFVIGVMGMTMLAFLLEYVQGVRQREEDENGEGH